MKRLDFACPFTPKSYECKYPENTAHLENAIYNGRFVSTKIILSRIQKMKREADDR